MSSVIDVFNDFGLSGGADGITQSTLPAFGYKYLLGDRGRDSVGDRFGDCDIGGNVHSGPDVLVDKDGLVCSPDETARGKG